MGLPGSGKTTLAKKLKELLKADWINADAVRKEYNDWDFSEEGRIRQAKRMSELADKLKKEGNFVIADFVCPLPKSRDLFNPDFIIWMDTIKKSKFDDTNKLFERPKNYDVRVTEKNAVFWSKKISNLFNNEKNKSSL